MTEPRPRKSLPRRMAVAGLATALALAGAEALVRALDVAPPVKNIELENEASPYRRSENALLGFELKPGYRNDEADCHEQYASINAHGQRDVERTLEKPAGVRRVLLVGDSVVEGFGVCEIDDTLSRQLEASYAGTGAGTGAGAGTGTGTGTEVLNFGVSGYCTRAEIEALEVKGLAFDPDVVVIVFVANDFDNFNRQAHDLGGGIERPETVEWLFRSSALFRVACLNLDLFEYRADDDPLEWNQDAIGDNNVADGLRRLRELADENGFEPLVCVWPDFGDGEIGEMHEMPDGSGELVVERLASMHGLPIARLSPYFTSDWEARPGPPSPRLLYTLGDRLHPNEEGCRTGAAAIRAVLDDFPARVRAAAATAVDEAALEAARSKGGEEANYSRIYNNRGLELFAQGELQAAETHFRDAIAADPDFAKAHYNLANTLFVQDRREEATEHYHQALRLRPDDPGSHYNFGVALLISGDLEGAEEHMREALRLDPELVDAHFHMGNILLARGNPAESIEHLRIVAEARPDAPEVRAALERAQAVLNASQGR